MTFAIASPGQLGVEIDTFSPNGWIKTVVDANVHMEFTGSIELPFLGDLASQIIGVGGTYFRTFDFGARVNAMLDLFNGQLKPVDLFLALQGFPEAQSISGTVSVGLSLLTGGLIGDLEMTAGIQAYKVPVATSTTKVGFYMSASADGVNGLAELLDSVCAKLAKALKSVGGGFKCPSLTFNGDTRMGLYIQLTEMGFSVEASPTRFECRVKNLDRPDKLGMNCQVNGEIFQLIENAYGFVVSKVDSLAADVADSATNGFLNVATDAVDLFKLTGNTATKTFSDVAQLLGQGNSQTLAFDYRFERSGIKFAMLFARQSGQAPDVTIQGQGKVGLGGYPFTVNFSGSSKVKSFTVSGVLDVGSGTKFNLAGTINESMFNLNAKKNFGDNWNAKVMGVGVTIKFEGDLNALVNQNGLRFDAAAKSCCSGCGGCSNIGTDIEVTSSGVRVCGKLKAVGRKCISIS